MRIITCILLFLLLSLSCIGQDIFEWISPKPINGVYENTEKYLNIRLRIDTLLSNAEYDILINGKSLYHNSRARVVPLGGLLSAKVPMLKVKNLVVTVRNGKDTYRSKSLSIINKIAPAPRLFLLTVGATPPYIDYTEEDAEDIFNVLTTQQCGAYNLYSEVFAKKLIGEDAKAKNILQAIKNITNGITPNDVFLLFIASHGKNIDDKFYIQGSDYNVQFPKETSVAAEQIYGILDNVSAKKLIFYDACESGGSRGTKLPIQGFREFVMKSRAGYNVITSSRGSEQSYHHPKWENGAFTEALIEGLGGRANTNEDEVITTDEIFDYVSKRVPQLCQSYTKNIQHPDSVNYELGDFPFFNGICTQIPETFEIAENSRPQKGFHIYIYQKTGQKYVGRWVNGKRNGEGLLYDSEGNLIYDGGWQNDLKNGKGTYFYEDGTY